MKNSESALQRDLKSLREQTLNRRKAIAYFAGAASVLPLVACGAASQLSDGTSNTDVTAGTTEATSGNATLPETATETGANSQLGTCSVIPEETAGPYPGDGSNGKNALVLAGIVRSDIRSSVGSASGVAAGVPLTVEITLINANDGCGSLEDYAIYLWHADRDGNYSMYSSAVASENYLRGVQETDANGKVVFQTIFPGCYDGRWPHIHFEIYPSLAKAVSSKNKVATSQLALPGNVCTQVYKSSGYSKSVTNLAKTSLTKDNVFSDGSSLQLATTEGDNTNGYVARLSVAIRA